jgi:O-antigen/teichoic acid export membrane protein
MSASGAGGPWRAVGLLLAGGTAAQAIPLLLGPLVTRLCGPELYGVFTAFAALAANLAVVACARYEFALPLARDEDEARALFDLSLWLLAALTGVLLLLAWPLAAWRGPLLGGWLAPAVAAAGAVSLMTLWATRLQRFAALSVARVMQHGGGALAQLALAWYWPSAWALVAGPVLAATLTAGWLWLKVPPARPGRAPRAALAAAARHFRDFPLINTPHAFVGALGDTLAVLLIAVLSGDAALGWWGLALRYLKAPATLVGSAVSQVLYPRLGSACTAASKAELRQVMRVLALAGVALAVLIGLAGPVLFAAVFGEPWRPAGELARALAPYIALHFVASPLAVVTMAWQAQAWALRLALVGQCLFLAALAAGLSWGGPVAAAWAVSAVMAVYFGWYFRALLAWREQ